jgi:ABC-2 type transport system ATP-binding protein
VRLDTPELAARARAIVARVTGGVMPETDPLVVAARLTSPGQAADVLPALAAAGIAAAEFSVGTPSLDEVFLALTGKPSEETAAAAR